MKFIVLILSLVFFLSAMMAEKVAILGDGQMADIAIAELSNDENIELLERSEVDKVLREHQLNTSGLSVAELKKYFPHCDIFVMAMPDRTVIFNAKNGFRLADEKNENTAGLVRQSIKKTQVANPEFLSIVTVRDVGVPRRLKSKIEETVTALEQNLMQIKQIQMLERNRLGTVSAERELSGATFTLVPSAKLLSIEFEPGSEANSVKIKLLISNLSKKEIARIENSFDFKSPEAIAKNLTTELVAKLNINPVATPEQKAEAARYFEEYKPQYHLSNFQSQSLNPPSKEAKK